MILGRSKPVQEEVAQQVAAGNPWCVLPGSVREAMFIKYPVPEEQDGSRMGAGWEWHADGVRLGAAWGAVPSPPTPELGPASRSREHRVVRLQLAANILMVGWSFA